MIHKHLKPLILGVLALASGLTSCGTSLTAEQPLPSDNASPTTVAQSSTSSEYAAMEQSVHQQINQYRQSRNLPPLTLNAQITEQARIHSADMASGRVPFSHNGFDGRVRAIAQSVSYRSAAENVAYNQGYSNPGEQAVQGWLKSTGHRQNIEGNYDITGIGITKNAKGEYYFTQIFIKRR